jgi:hypothetical protein
MPSRFGLVQHREHGTEVFSSSAHQCSTVKRTEHSRTSTTLPGYGSECHISPSPSRLAFGNQVTRETLYYVAWKALA